MALSELNLTPEDVDVLKQAGIVDLPGLAEGDVTELQRAFIAAAKEGKYPGRFPSLVKIAAWVEQARTLSEHQPEDGPSKDLDNIPSAVVKKKKVYRGSGGRVTKPLVELRPDRHARRKRDPEAPAPASGERVTLTPRREEESSSDVLEELNPDKQRALHQRRQDRPLHKPTAEKKEAATTPEPEPAPEKPAAKPESAPVVAAEKVEEAPTEEEALVAAPFRSFDDYKQGKVRVKPLDRHSLIIGEDESRSTGTEQESFEEELVYKKRMPIWRIRGVKHPDGLKVYLGAMITCLAVVLVLLTAIGAILFPIYQLDEYRLHFAALFGLTLVVGLIYIIMAIGMRCRVCSCHLFYSRRCLKNVKAHRILGAFPMFAQTLHILCWRWFRCMYCGTAIRLSDDHRDRD